MPSHDLSREERYNRRAEILRMRRERMPWVEIGGRFGITRQRAHQIYSAVLKEEPVAHLEEHRNEESDLIDKAGRSASSCRRCARPPAMDPTRAPHRVWLDHRRVHRPGQRTAARHYYQLTIKHGDEGHSLSVLAYGNGRFDSTTSRNGSFGVPQVLHDAPRGAEVLTAFADGRENTPATPVAGFRPLHVLVVDGGPGGDRDLYQLNRLDPPGSWRGGAMVTGNLARPGSGYWGLVNINIVAGS